MCCGTRYTSIARVRAMLFVLRNAFVYEAASVRNPCSTLTLVMSLEQCNASSVIASDVVMLWDSLSTHVQRRCTINKWETQEIKESFRNKQALTERTQKQKDRRALKPKVKGERAKAKAKVESNPVKDDTASSEEAQAKDAPTVEVAPAGVDVHDPSHLWRPVLCWVRCDPDGSVSTPFPCTGPIAGAPVKQIAA